MLILYVVFIAFINFSTALFNINIFACLFTVSIFKCLNKLFNCWIASGWLFRADPELVKFLIQVESGTEDEVFHPCPQTVS